MNRLVTRHLVEPNTRSTEDVEGASHVRVTSAGWFFYRYLIETFAYLDLVLQDTPINDAQVERTLRQSVYDVNNLPDDEDQKVRRTEARFERVETFITYLANEEERERIQFGLDRITSPIAEPIMERIKKEFEDERDWIRKRIRENREKYKEEYAYQTYEDEEVEFAGDEDDSGASEQALPEAANETQDSVQ